MEELLSRLMQQSQLGGVFPTSKPPPERPTDSAEELANCRKPCECGYNPHADNYYEPERCSVKLALRNHITFPSFEMMSEYDDPSMLYYEENNIGLAPSRHWATLIEITHDLSFVRPGCSGMNQFGERISVHFYHDNDEKPVAFKWSQLKAGNTLAILYPEKKTFLDMSEGIREENLDACFIFNSSLINVQDEAQKMLKNADREANANENEHSECFNCGVKAEKLSRCSVCKIANYCSKECQTKAWKDCHKNLCKQSDVLLRLAVLPRYRFGDRSFTFNEKSEHSIYLKPYKQIAANRYKANKKKGRR